MVKDNNINGTLEVVHTEQKVGDNYGKTFRTT